MLMDHRERVLTTLKQQEPDRVPIDFEETVDSTISAQLYQALRQELSLNPSFTRVLDVFQQTAVVEDDVRDALDVDTTPVFCQLLHVVPDIGIQRRQSQGSRDSDVQLSKCCARVLSVP